MLLGNRVGQRKNAGDLLLVSSLGREEPLEEGMATHASILAWRVPCTEEPVELQSIGSQRVRYDLVTEHSHSLIQ